VNGYSYDGFVHSAALVRAGEVATRAALPQIRKWLEFEPEQVKLRKPRMVQPQALPAD
jgi:hypothetical protein